MTYTVTSGQLHTTVEADSPIEAAKIALHECGTVELDVWVYVCIGDESQVEDIFMTERIISLLGQTIL